jgi:hypothetical protein
MGKKRAKTSGVMEMVDECDYDSQVTTLEGNLVIDLDVLENVYVSERNLAPAMVIYMSSMLI